MKSRTPPSASATAGDGPPLLGLDSAILSGVNVKLEAVMGQASLTIEDLLKLRGGAVLTLNSQLNDLVELRLNGKAVGRGEIVAVDDHFGIRVVDVAPPE